MSNQLTSKQENCCQHLIDGLNQTDDYKDAGYSFDNKLPATFYQTASRLAADSKVLARIHELRETYYHIEMLSRKPQVKGSTPLTGSTF